MIQANELRIGNWVLVDGEYVQVRCVLDGNPFEEPIDITPEILEKVGFSVSVVGNPILFLDKNWKLVYHEGSIVCEREGIGNEYGFRMTHVDNLHQLQNLYFALTGEELTIKLPADRMQGDDLFK